MTHRKAPTPTETDLREGAKLIGYELAMLAEAARLWNSGLQHDSKANRAERRMVTEVFLLHARNLLDFVAPRPTSRSTDVLAEHYEPSWCCSDRTQFANRPVNEWRGQIDKLLSHITYSRRAIITSIGEEPRWPIEAFHRELTAKINEFLETLPESRRTWFEG